MICILSIIQTTTTTSIVEETTELNKETGNLKCRS